MARAGQVLDLWQRDAVDVMLAVRDDGQWACFECAEIVARQNGKGAILEARALAGFFLLGERLIMWSAHEYKTAMEAFRRVKQLVRALGIEINENLYEVDGILVKVINTNGEESFERLDTGARIKFVARSKGSGRGFSADCNIIDEAFAYTPEQQSALLYTLSARPNPQIIYTSSPPLSGDSGEILYALRHRGDPTLDREPEDGPWAQDPSLSWRDWGMGGDLGDLSGVDLADMDCWAATNPALGVRITLETVGRERRASRGTPADFARERLGIWPPEIKTNTSQVIAAELWEALSEPDSERPTQVAFAVDVSPDRETASICAAGVREDGRVVLSLVDHRPGTKWIPGRVKALKARWNPIVIALDGKSPAATLVSPLKDLGIEEPEDPEKLRRGDLVVLKAEHMAVAWGLFVDAVRDRQVVHLDDAALNVALAGAKVRNLGDGSAWARRGGTDITPLVSATEAHWALTNFREAVSKPYDALANIW
jgi:phage terminase large subunit-like protein